MHRFGLASLVGLFLLGPARGQDGLFADFSTSMGDFTVQLDFERAPRAAASFVGLATGAGGWADPQGGTWHKPFYDGSLFHRVVKDAATNGIAIQGGGIASLSVNTNTGVVTTNFVNAGYYMLDSATNGLVHSNGVISMANSGPNTDGSQFFITTTNVPAWDGSYSVFGHVTTGMNVVTAIAAVAVQGAGMRPVQDVVLSNVVVRRVGAAAAAFSITNQGVPVAESGPMRNYASGSNLVLEIELAPQSETLLRESADLQTWEGTSLSMLSPSNSDPDYHTNAATVMTGAIPRSQLGDAYYFHASRIRYPTPITSPTSVRARTFTFWWTNTTPQVTYEAVFATNWWVQGDYTAIFGTNPPVKGKIFIPDTWTRSPYSARLYFLDNSGREYGYSLWFNPGQATNQFMGYWKWATNSTQYGISGVFSAE